MTVFLPARPELHNIDMRPGCARDAQVPRIGAVAIRQHFIIRGKVRY